jgi:predicted alpha/beta superfamily hydrolase
MFKDPFTIWLRLCLGASLVSFLSARAASAQAETVTIEFRVTVPEDTPADVAVYIAGNQPAAGRWVPGAVPLQKRDDGRWGTKLTMPKGETLEYKFTLGSWARVENDTKGGEIRDRVLRLDADGTVYAVVERWADASGSSSAARREHTLTGILEQHRDFPSKHLALTRDVLVYLPPGYRDAANATTRYPVLYLHDGQNLFDAATSFAGVEWRLDETAERLIKEEQLTPIIIVGIYNTPARMTEYTYSAETPSKGRSGEEYLRFVVEELKPLIDRTYRTLPDRKNTAVGGSSLGGLISLYMASTRPDVFSMAGVVSPALFWDETRAIKDVRSHAPYPPDVKFWVDIGTEEGSKGQGESLGSAVTDCRSLIAEFRKAGLVEGVHYKYLEVTGAKHNESAWSQRVDQMLIYFFGKVPTADPGMQTWLTIEPSKENPRNSEGDIIELKDGRLRLIYTRFTGGGGDDAAADLAMRISQDRGRSWSNDKIVIRHTGGLNVMSVSLLRLASGEIALFYLRKTSQEDCRPMMCVSTDEAQTWSEPTVCITDEVGYYVLNNDRAVQLHSGRLILPVAWHQGPGRKRDSAGVIMCYLSDDNGKSWRRSKDSFRGYAPGGQRITVQEPGVIELKDGRLMMYLRTNAGSQYVCHSPDGGETWSKAEPSALASPLSPATIKRVPWAGDLLCVWNDHSGAHPYPVGRRAPLCLAVSKDEGRTWSRSQILEGDPDGWYCYTSITFLEDRMLLAYCAGDKKVGGLNRLKVLALSQDRLTPSSLTPDAKAGME